MNFKVIHIALAVFLVFSSISLLNSQITFIENLGQWDDRAAFRSEINGAFLYLGADRITYNLYEPALLDHIHPGGKELEPRTEFCWHAYEVRFLHCNAITPSGIKPKSHFHNYYLDRNPEKWAEGVKLYDKVDYDNLYDGIGMIIYQGGNSLKYDFIVEPGADPKDIQLDINGADEVRLVNGELVITTKVNTVTESEPYTYQFIGGKIINIESSYILKNGIVSFKIGDYNPAYKLIIDPELILSTGTGSTSSNFGFTATYDQDENLIAGGNVFSNGFPTTLGAFQTTFGGDYSDAYITKFSDDGSELLYSSYIGGSDNERPHSIISSLDNDIYVMGTTGSANFPITDGAYDTSFNGGSSFDILTSLGDHDNGCDIFIAQIDGENGGLVACTFLGGTGNDGLNASPFLEYNYADVFRGEIIIDEDEAIYITTSTSSQDFPTTALSAQSVYGGGVTDGVVFKMNSNLSVLQWSTYFGGSADDSGYSLQPDSEGNLYMAGGTNSSNLPTSAGVINTTNPGGVSGYVTKFNSSGSAILGCTYMGTGNYDQTYFIQLDPDDGVYVVGQTTGNYPIQGTVYSNPNSGQFIHKFTNDLNTSLWSTTIGTGSGEVDISPTAFLVSDCNKIFLAGWGGVTNGFSQAISSTTFGLPITSDAYQSSTDGSDFYLIVLEEEATGLLYATYFGGGISNEHVDGGTSKFSKDGVVYQAVCAGCGSNNDFPSTSNAWSNQNNTANCDLGVFKFNLGRAEVEIGLDAPDIVCLDDEVQLTNLSDQDLDIEWNFGNNETSLEDSPLISYDEAGTYIISLTGNDNTGCLDGNLDQVTIEVVGDVNPEIIAPTSICEGEEITVTGIGTDNAYWEINPLLPNLIEHEVSIQPSETVTIEFTDLNVCSEETVTATIEVDALEIEIAAAEEICLGESITVTAEGGTVFEWTNEDEMVISETASFTVSPEVTSTYTLYSATSLGCEGEGSVTIEVVAEAPGGDNYGPLFVCESEELTISANAGNSWFWTPGEFTTQSIVVNPIDATLYEVLINNVCGEGIDQVFVQVGAVEAIIMEPDSICYEDDILLTAGGGVVYNWSNLTTGEEVEIPFVSPENTSEFQVVVTDVNGCQDSTTTIITVLPLPLVDAGPNIEVMFLDTAVLMGSVSTEDYWWSSHEDLSCVTCLEPTVYPSANHWYFLNVIDEFGCMNYDGVLVEVTGPLYVPNSFTPNGDGINDVFRADGLLVAGFNMQIYNRWGEMIFESNDPAYGWDGRYKEFEPIIDTYTWRISYKDYKYGRKISVGHVTLVE